MPHRGMAAAANFQIATRLPYLAKRIMFNLTRRSYRGSQSRSLFTPYTTNSSNTPMNSTSSCSMVAIFSIWTLRSSPVAATALVINGSSLSGSHTWLLVLAQVKLAIAILAKSRVSSD